MRKSTPENPAKNLLEWIVFSISAVLVLSTLSFLVYSALRVPEGPALLRAEAAAPVYADGVTRVPVTVKNEGKRVAVNVEVQVSVGDGDQKLEGSFTIDFVPRDAVRSGAVSFSVNPLPGPPKCEVIGYDEP